jgi:FtsP/CotA-like multicopper oxidase with cupredoxin domain
MISRRTLIATLGAAAGGVAAFMTLRTRDAKGAMPVDLPRLNSDGQLHFKLVAGAHDLPLLGDAQPLSKVWLFNGLPFPVMRVKRGAPVTVDFQNNLPTQHTTVHWHGIRLENAMDGVPNITQKPVLQGESFTYTFAPPDAGTFFFHPHCNEATQVGHGLVGVLIVDGDEREAFDFEEILCIKDWRVKPGGTFDEFVTSRGASRAGTFGNLRHVNGKSAWQKSVPAAADLRIRLLNFDPSRIIEVGVEGADAWVIAIDGHAVQPFKLDTWRMGTAMRIDLAVRTPEEGKSIRVLDYAQAKIFEIATFSSRGTAVRNAAFSTDKLLRPNVPLVDLKTAEQRKFMFSAASPALDDYIAQLDPADPLALAMLDSLCTGSDTFWAINRKPWPRDGHTRVPPPLETLQTGKTYRFQLQNATPHAHPIHLHGHTFQVLSSSKRDVTPYWADTVLLSPKERIDIAFVAAPGNWMFHCHILEHTETGMMGYVSVA